MAWENVFTFRKEFFSSRILWGDAYVECSLHYATKTKTKTWGTKSPLDLTCIFTERQSGSLCVWPCSCLTSTCRPAFLIRKCLLSFTEDFKPSLDKKRSSFTTHWYARLSSLFYLPQMWSTVHISLWSTVCRWNSLEIIHFLKVTAHTQTNKHVTASTKLEAQDKEAEKV